MNFWSNFTPAACLPSHCNCEFVQKALIAQPSAFYTSFFYILCALILWWRRPQSNQAFNLWVLCLSLLAFSSSFAHGSFIEIALAMDFASIIVVLSFFPIQRLMSDWIKFKKLLFILGYFLLLCYIFYGMYKWIKVGICLVVLIMALIEIFLRSRNFSGNFYASLAILAASFLAFILDEQKIICSPYSWIHGHSIWHAGSACSLYMYSKWRFSIN